MRRSEAERYRRHINAILAPLTDETAVEVTDLFEPWSDGKPYAIGDRVKFDGDLYKCVQAHTARSDWMPAEAVSLWARVLIPDPDVIPEWEQPDSTNPYMTGDKVRHNDKVWVSIIDYNVFEPGVAGWDEVIDNGN